MVVKVPRAGPGTLLEPRSLQIHLDQIRRVAEEATADISAAQTTATTAESKADAAQADIDAHKAATSAHGATGDIVGRNDAATTALRGVVLQGASVTDLALTASSTYVQSELQAVADKIDELLSKLRTAGVIAP